MNIILFAREIHYIERKFKTKSFDRALEVSIKKDGRNV